MNMEKSYDLILEDTEKFKDYFLDNEKDSITYFPKFNSINIIVGANNSGKSRFMRHLMSLKDVNGVIDLIKIRNLIPKYNRVISELNIKINENIEIFDHRAKNTYYVSGRNTDEENSNTLVKNLLIELQIKNLESFSSIVKDNIAKISRLKSFNIKNDYLSNFKEIEESFLKEFKDIKRYFIPTLRSAHSLFQIKLTPNEKDIILNNYEKIEKDIFLHTYLKNYQIDKSVEIFTGLHLYREILNSRNSEKSIRNQFEKFEKFLSIYFFDGKQIDIVAKFDKTDNEKGINESELILIHVDGDANTRKLYDLGDGIQALIVLMYKIFMAEPKSFIFIDEPELNLHPGMQRLFLEQISGNPDLKKKDLKYIISTHSNHFLDLTIEKENVSIYSFSPKIAESDEKQFIIKNVNRGDNQLLKDLGVNNSSVFMANCSIWVEGISDRNYIKAFLKSYCDSIKKPYLKEDIDFAFFEYAGSNIDHYIFEEKTEKEDEQIILEDIKALAVSNRIFLLADSDATKLSTKKGNRLKALEEAKSDNFVPKIIWNVREVENLLTNDIWKEVLIDLCNKTLVKSHKDEIIKKIDEALSEIDSLNFSKKYIGEFLESLRIKMGKISSTYILNQSAYEIKTDSAFGTIVNKRELSESVFNKNFSWEVLSKNKEIESLTTEIYNFIVNKN